MNAVNNEIDNEYKQSGYNINCIKKTPATENEHDELENSQLPIENPDFTESKIKIDEMKQNISRELVKAPNTDMKERESPKRNRKISKTT